MTAKKVLVALALLLSASSAALAQGHRYHRPGPYFGNDYGPGFHTVQSNERGSTMRQ
jgi:hypothetical protein